MKPSLQYLLAFTLVFIAGACSRGSGGLSSRLPYKSVHVENGGAIAGTVRYAGTRPTAQPMRIDRDQEVCGSSHPNPSDPGMGDGISGAVVYLEGIREGKAFDSPRDVGVDEHNCEFTPHLLLLGPDQKLLISNLDKEAHDFHVYLDERSIANLDQPIGASQTEFRMGETGLHRIGCDLHPWMHGYVMVEDHPYYVLTDRDGKFSLTNIPPGKYLLKVWRDSWVVREAKGTDGKIAGYDWDGDFRNQQPVEVRPNATTSADLTIH